MTAILTLNTLAGRDSAAPAPSLKLDGTHYQWRMSFDENKQFADADTLGELLEVFIPNYTSKDETSQLAARIIHARGVQLQLRSNVIASLTDEEDAALTDVERNVLFYENGDPSGWGQKVPFEDGTTGFLDVWESDIPLILLDTNYAPFPGKPARPLSSYGDYDVVPNIVYLRPSDEFSYLQSLHMVKAIVLGTPAPAPVGMARRAR